jgi:hypothetical protein
LVTGGEGWYQEDGKPAQALKPGDVIVTHDGVKHWHGAAKDSWFEHIAITAGKPEWLESVSEELYEGLAPLIAQKKHVQPRKNEAGHAFSDFIAASDKYFQWPFVGGNPMLPDRPPLARQLPAG